MWELEFFEKKPGRCPTLEFVQEQEKQERVLIERMFGLLEEYGNNLRRPYVDYLEDGLYELRVKVARKQYRFIYFFHNRRIIVVTHGFLKKGGSVPEGEIGKAKDYRTIYLRRAEKK
jgi:phage-related protein